jgi:Ni,Fe-hydrogenase I large subunit
VSHSWYTYNGDDGALKHPWDGVTAPTYTGPEPPFETLEGSDKYSWLKAPRYEDQPMEVGPLARMLVAYASGHPDVKAGVDGILSTLGVGPEALFSTLGRVAARALETKLLVARMSAWQTELEANLDTGDLAIADISRWDPASWPADARGWGMEEAPRGALAHWVVIKDQKIANYQFVVPSTWNGSPRDAKGPGVPGRRPSSGPRSLTLLGRWRSSARSTRSIRAWPARSTSTTPPPGAVS